MAAWSVEEYEELLYSLGPLNQATVEETAIRLAKHDTEVLADGWDAGCDWRVRHPQIQHSEYMQWSNPYRRELLANALKGTEIGGQS